MASGEPEPTAQNPVTESEPTEPEARNHAGQRLWLLGGGLVVIAAIVIGSAIGAWLGTREGGPLSDQITPNGRPTIVVATAAAVKPSASASPSPPPASAPTAAAGAPGEAASEYIVRPGDTLRTIAEQEYGDATAWPRIYQANRDAIGPDPDALKAGTRLELPR